MIYSNHQLALAAAAVVATVAAVVKKTKSKKKKKKKKKQRRESESSSILSSCISAVSSLISDKESKRIVVLDAIQHICTVSNDNQQDIYYKTYIELWREKTANWKQSFSAAAVEVTASSSL
eukprot:scaffold2084_cov155-Skeletonema_menzelii.AAC.6